MLKLCNVRQNPKDYIEELYGILHLKTLYGIHDPVGLSYLTQLRVSLSKLNLHKFKHNFRDALDAMCPSNDGVEDEEHFLLLCPSFDTQRSLLDRALPLIRPLGFTNPSNEFLTHILLYGCKDFPANTNRELLQGTISFIERPVAVTDLLKNAKEFLKIFGPFVLLSLLCICIFFFLYMW